MGETLASAPSTAQPAYSGSRLVAGALFANRYEIVAALGQGGMGAVYRVRDRELGEDIALKVLKPELADVEGALDRFRREVKLARRVTHPNVARTYDLGFDEGLRFLTMELILGEPLGRLLSRASHRLPLSDALRVAAEIARGLAAAHAVGVVHRDLKPDNVMIADPTNVRALARPSMPPSIDVRIAADERVVLTDFGIARLAEGSVRDTSLRTMGSAIGTPAYMAPEQIEGRELDGRADVYALGIVLFELLTGELPFKGDTVYALAAARLSGEPPDPRTVDRSIPEVVARLVLDAMARKREERPDAQTFLSRIDALRGGPSADGSRAIGELRAPRLDAIDLSRITPSGPRTIAVLPLEADLGNAELQRVAADLTAAVADALAGIRGVRLLPPGSVHAAIAVHTHHGMLDPAALARALNADFALEGSLRVAQGKARVRTHLVDAATNVQSWAERFEGPADDVFALEDQLVVGVTQALRARVGDGAIKLGPPDPVVRDLYDRGRAEYARFGPPHTHKAIEFLRQANEKAPNDPWVMSALGAALTRSWLLGGALDRELIAEAEEISLRALAIDSSIGDTFNTIGILRLQHGETRAAVRAFQEAISRSPTLAEAHSYLGRLLAESGYHEEARRRFDLAIRLDPQSLASYWEKARMLALLGDRSGAEVLLERSSVVGGPLSGLFIYGRFVMWYRDKQLAARVVATIEGAGDGAAYARAVFLPIVRAFAEGKGMGDVVELFRSFAQESSASPRQRSFFYQLLTEYNGVDGKHEEALVALEKAAALPLIDLTWLDRCPALDGLRDDPRFLRARATTAARVAELWA